MRAQSEGWLLRGVPFSEPWLWEVWGHWVQWGRGFPPARAVRAPGELPYGLARAFTVLDVVAHLGNVGAL